MANKIRIFNMYPDAMNLYGDIGNIISIIRRAILRGIDVEVIDVRVDDKVDFTECDLLFLGGGQDSGQKIIAEDLLKKGPAIKNEVEKGMVAFTVCGGFQLFGKYFQMANGEKIQGIDVFDAYTIASDKRLIGNAVVDIAHTSTEWHTKLFFPSSEATDTTLVGFENHSGKTTLGPNCQPLGYVIRGYGNMGDGNREGGVYKNAFGTYLHGSLLPKNPKFSDHLILLALYRRYGSAEALIPLDDTIENEAHLAAIERSKTAKTLSI
jgi:hypothetical protein